MLSRTKAWQEAWSVLYMVALDAAAIIVTSAILAASDPRGAAILTGSNPRPLSHYCSLAATFGELHSLGDSHACLLVLSAPLQSSRSLAVHVYSAIHSFT